MSNITGLTRGGDEWTPTFVTALDDETCIGCGRCFKVCPRNVFDLEEREPDDDDDCDDVMSVMVIADANDCIGCSSCARVCPKNCHTHEPMAAA
ncbi:ferredoxin III, nif-specific [Marinospirillum perlucidum]|uniref:ferredoxin III, nif-specific n=1 Tax=Marinospirillum perlucidum TaxID=1982602 RepID=UPI000DF14782|nr:ferredoxin III, nif-specific [Marinospirillum perlucidum]